MRAEFSIDCVKITREKKQPLKESIAKGNRVEEDAEICYRGVFNVRLLFLSLKLFAFFNGKLRIQKKRLCYAVMFAAQGNTYFFFAEKAFFDLKEGKESNCLNKR